MIVEAGVEPTSPDYESGDFPLVHPTVLSHIFGSQWGRRLREDYVIDSPSTLIRGLGSKNKRNKKQKLIVQ